MAPGTVPLHFVRLQDLSDQQVEDLLDLALRLKRGVTRTELSGRSLGLLFFRGSLRTRTSLEVAAYQLGGHTVNLNAATDFWELESHAGSVMDGKAPEHVKDVAAVLSGYVNVLAIRPDRGGTSWSADRRDEDIRTWAEHARVPVINMESTLWHPLQALADMMTMREALGQLKGRKLSIVWTHSPTPATPAPVHSLLHAALRSGMDVRIAHPAGFELDRGVLSEANALADESGDVLCVGLNGLGMCAITPQEVGYGVVPHVAPHDRWALCGYRLSLARADVSQQAFGSRPVVPDILGLRAEHRGLGRRVIK